MRAVFLFLLGMLAAYAVFLAAVLLLFKRGGWELEQYDQEDGYAD